MVSPNSGGSAGMVFSIRPAIEVKGPTLTELSLRQADDGLWHARCVVDV